MILSAIPSDEVASMEHGAQARDLLIVIPAYNERGHVGDVIADVQSVLPGVDVLVVDDGSTDGTATEAARAGASVLILL